MSSRLSDLAPTAALGSILRFKLKRGGLRCYGYSVFTLTAPAKPSTNGSIVVVESLSHIGETQKAFTGPSISSGCLWKTYFCICCPLLQASTAFMSMMTLQHLSTLKTITKASTFLFSFFPAGATSGSTATSQPSHLPCACRLFSNCLPRVERSEDDSQRPLPALSHRNGSQILIESRDLN